MRTTSPSTVVGLKRLDDGATPLGRIFPCRVVERHVSGARYATCQTCRDLLHAYKEESEKLGPLTKELSNVAISYEADAFDRIWNRVQLAQKAVETARDAFRAHILTHPSPDQ